MRDSLNLWRERGGEGGREGGERREGERGGGKERREGERGGEAYCLLIFSAFNTDGGSCAITTRCGGHCKCFD